MWIAAIVFNVILLGVVVFLFAVEGLPEYEEWVLVVPMTVAPLCSIIALLKLKGFGQKEKKFP